MARGAAVFGDQLEPVFDVVVGFCCRELLGGDGFQREVPAIPQQPDPGRAFAGWCPFQGDRSFAFVQAKLFGLQVGVQSAFQNHFTVDGQHR